MHCGTMLYAQHDWQMKATWANTQTSMDKHPDPTNSPTPLQGTSTTVKSTQNEATLDSSCCKTITRPWTLEHITNQDTTKLLWFLLPIKSKLKSAHSWKWNMKTKSRLTWTDNSQKTNGTPWTPLTSVKSTQNKAKLDSSWDKSKTTPWTPLTSVKSKQYEVTLGSSCGKN